MERWVVCTRHDGYEVSDLGRVRRRRTQRVLKPTQNWSRGGRRPGYFHVTLGTRCQYVHHLVAEAFLGPRPDGHDIDHVNWDRSDNSARNLRYLPLVGNRMRWTGPGRNDFDSSKHLDREPDEGFVPMTEQERAGVLDDLESAQW